MKKGFREQKSPTRKQVERAVAKVNEAIDELEVTINAYMHDDANPCCMISALHKVLRCYDAEGFSDVCHHCTVRMILIPAMAYASKTGQDIVKVFDEALEDFKRSEEKLPRRVEH